MTLEKKFLYTLYNELSQSSVKYLFIVLKQGSLNGFISRIKQQNRENNADRQKLRALSNQR